MYIKEIRSVHFSQAGQAAASAFNERIVRSVDAKLLKYKGTINNRAAYFFKLCHEMSREKNMAPNKQAAEIMHEEFGTNDRMPMMLSAGKNPSAIMDMPAVLMNKIEPARSENPFTLYHQSLDDAQREQYTNDFPPYGYRHCTPTELLDRQKQFVSLHVPDAALNFLPMGYADRVYQNLRFMPLVPA